MKNNVVIRISGPNAKRFINKIIKNNIEVFNLNKISKSELIIEIDKKYLDDLYRIKGIYNLDILSNIGIDYYKKIFYDNFIMYTCLILCIIIIIFLSNFIFGIQIYHDNTRLKNMLLNELNYYGIKIGAYGKSFDEIENIKHNILSNHKNDLEWLEITKNGTIYEVRFEERLINNKKNNCDNQNIVAKKNAILKKIYASSGIIVKNENDYVSSGDVIISGNIFVNDELKTTVCANGVVYGETWYTVKVNYPLYSNEKSFTGKEKSILNISFLNKNFNLFNFKPYKNYDVSDNIIFNNKILPIKFSLQKQKELFVIEKPFSYKEAYNEALNYSIKKMNDILDTDEYIISKKVLKNEQKDSTIYMEIFFKVYENITGKEIINTSEEDV